MLTSSKEIRIRKEITNCTITTLKCIEKLQDQIIDLHNKIDLLFSIIVEKKLDK